MWLLFGGLLGFILFGMLVAAFAMSIVALNKKQQPNDILTTPTLLHPAGGNLNSSAPTVVTSTAGGTNGFTTASMVAGSTDTSGAIAGTVTSGGTVGLLTVTFGTPYATVPKSVLITPTDATAWTVQPQVTALSLTTTGFSFRATPTSPVNLSTPLFFYMVL